MSTQRMKICVFIITFGLLLIIPKETVSQGALSQVFPIGPDSVWNPSDAALSQYRQEDICKNLISVMSETGASPQAIALAEMLEGKQYLDSFKKMGRVDLGTIVLPFANYPDTEYVLVNGWRDLGWRTRPLMAEKSLSNFLQIKGGRIWEKTSMTSSSPISPRLSRSTQGTGWLTGIEGGPIE
jgi:hypothetical protein